MAVQLHGLANSIQMAPLGRDYICGDCTHLCAALQGCSDERHSARIADKIVPIAFMTGGAQPALGVSKCESHPARMAIRVGLAGNCSDPQPPSDEGVHAHPIARACRLHVRRYARLLPRYFTRA